MNAKDAQQSQPRIMGEEELKLMIGKVKTHCTTNYIVDENILESLLANLLATLRGRQETQESARAFLQNKVKEWEQTRTIIPKQNQGLHRQEDAIQKIRKWVAFIDQVFKNSLPFNPGFASSGDYQQQITSLLDKTKGTIQASDIQVLSTEVQALYKKITSTMRIHPSYSQAQAQTQPQAQSQAQSQVQSQVQPQVQGQSQTQLRQSQPLQGQSLQNQASQSVHALAGHQASSINRIPTAASSLGSLQSQPQAQNTALPQVDMASNASRPLVLPSQQPHLMKPGLSTATRLVASSEQISNGSVTNLSHGSTLGTQSTSMGPTSARANGLPLHGVPNQTASKQIQPTDPLSSARPKPVITPRPLSSVMPGNGLVNSAPGKTQPTSDASSFPLGVIPSNPLRIPAPGQGVSLPTSAQQRPITGISTAATSGTSMNHVLDQQATQPSLVTESQSEHRVPSIPGELGAVVKRARTDSGSGNLYQAVANSVAIKSEKTEVAEPQSAAAIAANELIELCRKPNSSVIRDLTTFPAKISDYVKKQDQPMKPPKPEAQQSFSETPFKWAISSNVSGTATNHPKPIPKLGLENGGCLLSDVMVNAPDTRSVSKTIALLQKMTEYRREKSSLEKSTADYHYLSESWPVSSNIPDERLILSFCPFDSELSNAPALIPNNRSNWIFSSCGSQVTWPRCTLTGDAIEEKKNAAMVLSAVLQEARSQKDSATKLFQELKITLHISSDSIEATIKDALSILAPGIQLYCTLDDSLIRLCWKVCIIDRMKGLDSKIVSQMNRKQHSNPTIARFQLTQFIGI
eukprot:TRINITY_DN7981_c0_g1_i4.p1 TRINITY_DN7981_c0_g1~~TRINITY_DN7981_c0_g1_i4.p1  ORF type:complete len:805 (-),score=131.08 TRINITY_DN7981_c0_g1_i4:64-2478(-)